VAPRHPSSPAGQAAAEYVALLTVLAIVLGAAAAVALPGLAPALAHAVREGICRVGGGVCTPAQARAQGLAPCVVHARRERERAAVKLAVIRLERGDALVVERLSDGRARVAFVDGAALTGEVAVGVALSPLGVAAGAEAGAGVRFAAGRVWTFASVARAATFVRRWSRREELLGEVRGACPVCGGGERPPRAAERYAEGGGVGALRAALGVGGSEAAGEASAVLGRRIAGAATTWYLRVDAALAAELGAVAGSVRAGAGSETVLEVTARVGRAEELRVRAAGRSAAELRFLAPLTRLRELARGLRGAAGDGRAGLAVEAEVALDLRDPASRRAAAGLLAALRTRAAPAEALVAARALGARLDAAGAVDLRTYRLTTSAGPDVELEAALGAGAGVEYEREAEQRELVRAWSLRPGGPLRGREDCEAAARA